MGEYMGTVRTSSLKMKLLIVLGCLMALASGHQKLVKSEQCGSDETSCPAECCPEANWYCCPDNMYCAATAADCPFVAQRLTGTAALTTCTVLPLLPTVLLLP